MLKGALIFATGGTIGLVAGGLLGLAIGLDADNERKIDRLIRAIENMPAPTFVQNINDNN